MKAIGRTIVALSSLPKVTGRIHKASRHKTAQSTTARRLVVHHKKDKKWARRPTLEDLGTVNTDNKDNKDNKKEKQEEKIAVDSISLHPTDHKWVLSSNNFSKTPARPRTQTAAETVPDAIIKAVFKSDLDAIIIWLSTHRAFDRMSSRTGEKLLHAAAGCGDLPLTTFLLDKGAKVGARDGYGEVSERRGRTECGAEVIMDAKP